MGEYILWVFLLALWNVILFFSKDYGISVILFMVPLMGYLYYVLKKNKKIINKNGLLYIIPILLLSLTYLLFDNYLFKCLNFLVIPILICLMIIHVTSDTYNIKTLLEKIIEILFLPYKYIARLFRVTKYNIGQKIKMSKNLKKILITLVIVIPISVIVIGLLSSADMIFENIFGKFFDKLFEILRFEFFDHLLGRITGLIIVFFIIGCTTMYIIYEFKIKKEEIKSDNKVRDLFTIKTLVTVLNVIYLAFDFIQIKSLLLHSVSSGINYAEYARRGFFELMIVSFINLAIILISRKFESKDNSKEYCYIKVMNVLMVFLTIIIIASSFLRMHLYEAAFGYTTLRLLVYAVLITESILMIPTVMYIFNNKFNIVKSYMIIVLISYLVVNFINIDYLVARRNVNRYYIVNDVDYDYLENYSSDNTLVLIELFNKTDEKDLKEELGRYLYDYKTSLNDEGESIFEFNISKYKARNKLNNIKFDDSYKGYLDFE